MAKELNYNAVLTWTGNTDASTSTYTSYERSYTVHIDGKPDLLASADPAFRGDAQKWNPEELFLASLSACHMLWYLHLCSTHKILVQSYIDSPHAKLIMENNGVGKFVSAELNPLVLISNPDQIELANSLHAQAHKFCFIANSINFPTSINPTTKT